MQRLRRAPELAFPPSGERAAGTARSFREVTASERSKTMRTSTTTSRTDLYSRVTERVIADLEKGVRPWLKPWSAGNGAGRVGLPRRHNGVPYRGINVLVLWG